MNTGEPLNDYLSKYPKESGSIFKTQDTDGYWSNLSKKQNAELMSLLGRMPVKKAIEATQPQHMEVIFSEKRAAGIELLKLKGTEVAVDLGCMWGALTIPLAKQAGQVLGIDQTLESLRFSEARAQEEHLKNVHFLCGNLRNIELPKETFDVAVVNGVLEWVPEFEKVVVDDYVFGAKKTEKKGNPGEMQKAFLHNVLSGLKSNGRLMLAIENRYDYKMFFGLPDPHTGTYFTTIVPRWMANLISKVTRQREYRPWIYSFPEIEALLREVGFSKVSLYACWPDYRVPDYLTPYGVRAPNFQPISARTTNGRIKPKRLFANRMEWLLFKVFNFQYFAPSIIAIAEK
jgi:cyclopropane fatty-acyl-phospholipid synthase-like methyltransferase